MSKEQFINRHIGPRPHEIETMVKKTGVETLNELIDQTIPRSIRLQQKFELDKPLSEYEFFNKIQTLASKNKLFRSFIGQGYYNTITPAVIQRNILENPSWYTSYTPYQAEISQGRLEALLNFQTMVMELTGMEIANASLLDEATAAAEAMIMMFNKRSRKKQKAGATTFFVDENIFPQTLAVLKTRAVPLGIELEIGNYQEAVLLEKHFGVLVQYPAADGLICDYKALVKKAHKNNSLVAVVADILSLALLSPPGEWDADIVTGSTQRFGIPVGYGGPHAAYFATREKFKRNIPGRIIGASKDRFGNNALRMALQTREQHIKRERATSNICTAQALLASMAGMFAVYHGAEGIRRIALHAHSAAAFLSDELKQAGYKIVHNNFFDTLKIELPDNITTGAIQKLALLHQINFNYLDDKTLTISTDETISEKELDSIVSIFIDAAKRTYKAKAASLDKIDNEKDEKIYFASDFLRKSDYLTENVFKTYRSETEMMRYLKRLEKKDISLTHSMISLGSCTMKLNAAVEMLPLSWPEFGNIHPFVPTDQAQGYQELFIELEKDLSKITGFAAVSLQPNSGAAGENTGLLVIREYLKSKGQDQRNVVLIPASAHGTNPASAVMAGMKVEVVDCDDKGNIDLECLRKKAEENSKKLAAFMVTYPSTHGVFESQIKEMCAIIHQNGGQVYMDGANMNAQIGYTNPAEIGADVCHLNLHKTFAIPHGGGGPGVGPIGVAAHLKSFLPSHPILKINGDKALPAVSAAPWGSASILPITFGYIKMLGAQGLKKVTEIAILNANYLATALKDYFPILYTGENNRVAHEMILDCRPFKASAGISETDIAKRLMDYGFHAPTLSFPVHGTLMVEPTESESLQELDRFVEVMISIYHEIKAIENNKADKDDNVLKNAPHPATEVAGDQWSHSYSRQQAAYPLKWSAHHKFWVPVARVDDAFGDRNLVCSCAPIDSYREDIYN